MVTTILIAKLLGVYFIMSGVFIITHEKTFAVIIKDLFGNRALMFIVGALLLVGGSAIVLRGDIASDSLSIFVRIIAWAILIKGALYMLSPEILRSITKMIPHQAYPVLGAIVAVLGLYLVFFLS